MFKIPDEKDVPENMKYYIYRYINPDLEYKCGAFMGDSELAIYEVPHIQALPEDVEVEIYEVTREAFIKKVKELEENSKNFMFKDFMTGESSEKNV